ncbi:MAG: class I SAM-dependent methyltransferase [Candidatus Micrarchaeota archaeon]
MSSFRGRAGKAEFSERPGRETQKSERLKLSPRLDGGFPRHYHEKVRVRSSATFRKPPPIQDIFRKLAESSDKNPVIKDEGNGPGRYHLFQEQERAQPEGAEGRARVLFVGCNISHSRNEWEQIKGGLGLLGLRRESANTVESLMGSFAKNPQPPRVVVVGLDMKMDGRGVEQAKVLKLLSGMRFDERTRTIVLYNPKERGPGTFFQSGLTAEEVLENDCASAEILLQRIQRSLKQHPSTPRARTFFDPMVCAARTRDSWNMDADAAAEARRTMIEFSYRYNQHMLMTGHFAAMLVMYYRLGDFFGNTIADVACGTGYPMRQFLEHAVVSKFRLGLREEPMLILSIDYLEEMLSQAHSEFNGLLAENEDSIRGRLGMCFKQADFLELTMEALKEIDFSGTSLRPEYLGGFNFQDIDTMLMSYVIYWLADKEAAVRKAAELIKPGGRLIIVEEPHLRVSPGGLDKDDAQSIASAVYHIPFGQYVEMILSSGFKPELDAKGKEVREVLEIDKISRKRDRSEFKEPHTMEGRVFRRRGSIGGWTLVDFGKGI